MFLTRLFLFRSLIWSVCKAAVSLFCPLLVLLVFARNGQTVYEQLTKSVVVHVSHLYQPVFNNELSNSYMYIYYFCTIASYIFITSHMYTECFWRSGVLALYILVNLHVIWSPRAYSYSNVDYVYTVWKKSPFVTFWVDAWLWNCYAPIDIMPLPGYVGGKVGNWLWFDSKPYPIHREFDRLLYICTDVWTLAIKSPHKSLMFDMGRRLRFNWPACPI